MNIDIYEIHIASKTISLPDNIIIKIFPDNLKNGAPRS
jgi:hypothetical protein